MPATISLLGFFPLPCFTLLQLFPRRTLLMNHLLMNHHLKVNFCKSYPRHNHCNRNGVCGFLRLQGVETLVSYILGHSYIPRKKQWSEYLILSVTPLTEQITVGVGEKLRKKHCNQSRSLHRLLRWTEQMVTRALDGIVPQKGDRCCSQGGRITLTKFLDLILSAISRCLALELSGAVYPPRQH